MSSSTFSRSLRKVPRGVRPRRSIHSLRSRSFFAAPTAICCTPRTRKGRSPKALAPLRQGGRWYSDPVPLLASRAREFPQRRQGHRALPIARLPEEPGRLGTDVGITRAERVRARPSDSTTPTSSSSTPARSSRARGRSRSTRSSRWPSCARPVACARSSSRAVCPSATAGSCRRSCRRSMPSSAPASSRASPRSSTPRSPAGAGGVYVESGHTYLLDASDPRLLVGPTHSAYLKIAEGCDRICAFCAIPGIRGRFQSRHARLVDRGSQAARRRGRARTQPGRSGLDVVGQGSAGTPGPGSRAPHARQRGRSRLDPAALRVSERGDRRADRRTRRREAHAPLRRRPAPARERCDASRDEARHDGGSSAPPGRAPARGNPGRDAPHHLHRRLPRRDRRRLRGTL